MIPYKNNEKKYPLLRCITVRIGKNILAQHVAGIQNKLIKTFENYKLKIVKLSPKTGHFL